MKRQGQTRKCVRQTKELTDAKIAAGFKQLRLEDLGKTSYTTPLEFSRTFKRCTLLENCSITTTAHAGV